MAHTSVHPTVSLPVMGSIRRFFSALGTAMISMGEASSRFRKIEALQALSDAELAKRGMKREDIVRVVFADAFHV